MSLIETLGWGGLIVALTWVFVWSLSEYSRDLAADRESEAADRETLWHLDWLFWLDRARDDNVNIAMTANSMLAYLQSTRPVDG